MRQIRILQLTLISESGEAPVCLNFNLVQGWGKKENGHTAVIFGKDNFVTVKESPEEIIELLRR